MKKKVKSGKGNDIEEVKRKRIGKMDRSIEERIDSGLNVMEVKEKSIIEKKEVEIEKIMKEKKER